MELSKPTRQGEDKPDIEVDSADDRRRSSSEAINMWALGSIVGQASSAPKFFIRIIDRAARHLEGGAIVYADKMTDSVRRAIDETTRHREKQIAYNTSNNITSQTTIRAINDALATVGAADYLDLTENDATLPDLDSIQHQTRVRHARSRQGTRVRKGREVAGYGQRFADDGVFV